MDLGLTGKVAVVAGGSRGIGRAIARALAAEGVDVAIMARDLAVANSAAAEIAARTGRIVRAYQVDAGIDDQVRRGFAQVASDFGRLDILVNSAAQPASHGGGPAKLPDLTDELFWADMNVKVLGALRCAREAEPHMRKNGWGRIINISGLNARTTGNTMGSMRNVSLAALSKNLGDELGQFGINVTCVHPGTTVTERTEWLVGRRAEDAGVSEAEMRRRMDEAVSIRRLVTAEEVADVVAFLASPRSVAINGDVIAAGGGPSGPIYY